jgi:hypothetical protein
VNIILEKIKQQWQDKHLQKLIGPYAINEILLVQNLIDKVTVKYYLLFPFRLKKCIKSLLLIILLANKLKMLTLMSLR